MTGTGQGRQQHGHAPDTGPQVEFAGDIEVAYAGRWSETAYAAVGSGDIVAEYQVRGAVETEVVTGPCPRCSHEVAWRRVASAVRGIEPVRSAAPAEEDYRSLVLTCGCGRSHAGHPERVTGCGASYRVPALVVSVGPVDEEGGA